MILKTFPTISHFDNWRSENRSKIFEYKQARGEVIFYDGSYYKALVCRTIHDAHKAAGYIFDRAEFHQGIPADCQAYFQSLIRSPLL